MYRHGYSGLTGSDHRRIFPEYSAGITDNKVVVKTGRIFRNEIPNLAVEFKSLTEQLLQTIP